MFHVKQNNLEVCKLGDLAGFLIIRFEPEGNSGRSYQSWSSFKKFM